MCVFQNYIGEGIITDVVPSHKLKNSMNRINVAKREGAEALELAQAESKHL